MLCMFWWPDECDLMLRVYFDLLHLNWYIHMRPILKYCVFLQEQSLNRAEESGPIDVGIGNIGNQLLGD